MICQKLKWEYPSPMDSCTKWIETEEMSHTIDVYQRYLDGHIINQK